MAENSFPPDEAIVMQELNYRICILETFRSFCRTAPLTTDVKVLGYHYKLVNAYVRFLLNEDVYKRQALDQLFAQFGDSVAKLQKLLEVHLDLSLIHI